MNAYDFDNTVFNGDSTARFYSFCLRRHPRIFLKLPGLFGAFISFYVFKRGDKTRFKQKMYRFLICLDDVDAEVGLFWEQNLKRIKPFYLKQKRNDDVIISASPEFLLSPVCEKLGTGTLIASRVDKKTGVYSGKNCHGEEKVRRFYEEFGRAEICSFYSDSHSDEPMAKLAKQAYMVKGDRISEWIFIQ